MGLVLRHALSVVTLGLAVGLALALASTRLLNALLYQTDALAPLTFAAIGGLLLLVAITACLIPARRAAKVQPLVALRHDWAFQTPS